MSYRISICAVALAMALLTAPSGAEVVDFSKYPNFKGQWVRTGNPNNWIALAGQPPLTPEYQKIWEGIQADLKAGAKIIAFVTKLPDGSFETSRIGVGRDGLTPPM